MRFERIKHARNSIKFRLLSLYFGLYTLSFLAFLGLSFAVFYNVLSREEDRSVTSEITEVSEHANDTLDSLLAYCDNEIMENGFTNLIFRVRGNGREYLLPSPQRWTGYPLHKLDDIQAIAGDIVLVHNAAGEPPLKVGTTVLPGGYVLQVGIVADSVQKLKSYFTMISGVIFLPILLAGLGIGLLMARKALEGITRVNDTATAIYQGDLSNRVARSHSGDEIDRLSETFNLMLARLQQLIGNMTEMVDNIAHDLRSPLTRLRGKLEVALLRQRSPEEYREAMESSLEDIDQLVGLISTVLNIAEAEAGTIILNKRYVDLPRFLEALCEFYSPMGGASGVELRLGEVAPVEVYVDETRLWQAVSNLLDNAFKFTSAGGHVTLLARRLVQEVAITVADTGVGIDPAECVNIFRRFYRHNENHPRLGYGLGLSLVKAVSEIHGGRAEVECPPEGGSRFSIVLPVARPQEEASRP
jgi:signal transduction histidine kinase